MALRYRATAALIKGATMGIFGLWVLSLSGWHAWHGTLPHPAPHRKTASPSVTARINSSGISAPFCKNLIARRQVAHAGTTGIAITRRFKLALSFGMPHAPTRARP
jgi:hypothetical protein